MKKILIGGSPCFAAGTLIKTIEGYKEIQNISIGDYVLTHKGRYMPVTQTMSKISDHYCVLKSENSEDIICTKEHPFYTKNCKRIDADRMLEDEFKWTAVKDFKTIRNSSNTIKQQTYLSSVFDNIESEYNYNGICQKINQHKVIHINNLKINESSFWYIVGRYLGDGWLKYRYRKTKKLQGVIICCGKDEKEELEKKICESNFKYCLSEERTTYRFTICNVEFATFLLQFGYGACNKHLTKDVYNLPKNLMQGLLYGYFDADGCVHEKIERHSASSISRELIYGIKYCIGKYMRKPCRINKSKRSSYNIEGRTGDCNPLYTISFPDNDKKQKHYFVEDNYILSPYKSVTMYHEEMTVYNLSVEEDESYTANGLVVHNCTYWSVAQRNNRETTAEGIGWELFKNYLIAKEKFQPDFFLYENNKSAAQPIKDQISRELSVELMYINSALVSAQNRQRFYAFNWHVEQPEDRGILLKDILESGRDLSSNEKSYCLTASYGGACAWNTLERSQRTMVAEPIRISTIENEAKNHEHDSKQYRVYSSEGKSTTICGQGGGVGAITGLYAVPVNDICGKSRTIKAQYGKNGIANFITNGGYGATAIAEPVTEPGNNTLVYTVFNGEIEIKGKKYPINLPSGEYIIRKLTPIECERLQTMPDNYTAMVSNTQRYKCLGNGWTAEVIIHILNGALKDVPRDEELHVLSMYDGIGTGRYCLDKLGFTNVKYHAYEIDKYAIQVAKSNYPDIIECGDAFAVREDGWKW